MSVISWNDLKVSKFRWAKAYRAVVGNSLFGSQSQEAASPVWEVELSGVPQYWREAVETEVFFESLNGYGNQLELWNLIRPVPLGTLRGNGAPFTLAANVAQGATSMQLRAGTSNLLTPPEDLDNAAWLRSGATVSPNLLIAPDGTLTADKIVESATTAEHYIERGVSSTGAGTWCFGVFVAKLADRVLHLRPVHLGETPTTSSATFNPLSGTFTGGLNGLGIARGVIEYPDWWRVWLTVQTTSAMTSLRHRIQLYAEATLYAGDGVSGIHPWGATVEESATPTDYGFGKTLLKGDLLGIGSGLTQQVVRIHDDAISTGQGNITVNIGTPLRNAFTAGTQVRWNKPKALFRQKAINTGIEYVPVIGQPWALSLVENWFP